MGYGPANRRWILPLCLVMIAGVPVVPAGAAGAAGATDARASGGGMPSVPKNAAVAVDAAKKAVMDAFGVQEGHGVTFTSSLGVDEVSGRRAWNLKWQIPLNGRGVEEVNASVDAETGDVLSFHRWQNDGVPFPPAVDREQARRTARALVEKLQPEKAKKTVEWPSQDFYAPTLVHYAFTFVRVENGVPYPADGFHVTVGADGRIASYQYIWSDVSFPAPAPAIGAPEAEAKLAGDLAVTAHYMPDPGLRSGYPPTRLVYTANVPVPNLTPGNLYLVTGQYVLDAATGRWIDGFSRPASLPRPAEADPLEPGGPQVPALRDKPLDLEEAEQVARSALDLGADAAVINKSFHDAGAGQHAGWNFDFVLPDHSAAHAGVDALTGEVLAFDRGVATPSAEDAGKGAGLSPEQARQAAVDFIKKVLPNRLGALGIAPDQPENPKTVQGKTSPAGAGDTPPVRRMYAVKFLHLHKGFVDDLSRVTVTVDGQTGRILNYYAYFADDPEMPGSPVYPEGQVKPADQAKRAYLHGIRMTLAYVRMQENPDEPRPGPVRLVYLPVSPAPRIAWDALSGTWVRVQGAPQEVNLDEIRGHWAEKELATVLQMGALQPVAGRVLPDQPVTRGDFVAALMRMVEPSGGLFPDKPSFADVPPDHPDYPYIEEAVRWGLIDRQAEFHPDAPLTRMEMADIIVRELGYGNLTKGEGIFQVSYSDMAGRSARDVVEAGVVSGLGIMRGSDGRFRPDDPATRAEAAVALYHLLTAPRPRP
ncbi:S-layer homology domain-containing protein [Kyrpidia tusciae]|uniref:S-layer domain protein n=1 Tax=Kyrpidia tusciae (strain DSM 2912 / NBRC 15312 / T2) TaxID=562970 RepID=D5WQY1_KYRT2|nr:S-layer homology domain-containing protein [Kyrpidia tusciae]ADG06740.1 S-layer domain protein [Kyrpidia tusciae DSM 2912]